MSQSISTLSNRFSDKEWLVAIRGTPRQFMPVYHIRAYETEADALKALDGVNAYALVGINDVIVIRNKEFFEKICNTSLEKKVSIQVDAHLGDAVFEFTFVPVDRDTVEIETPEMA